MRSILSPRLAAQSSIPYLFRMKWLDRRSRRRLDGRFHTALGFHPFLRPSRGSSGIIAIVLCLLVAGFILAGLSIAAPETATQPKGPSSGTFGEDRICDYCRIPFRGGFIVVGEKKYHEHCYEDHIALKCSICGQIIEGRYTYDFWGNKYHSHHESDIPRCEYCRRFITQKLTGGGVEYRDGRKVCKICRKSAVTKKSQAQSLLKRSRKLAADLGMPIGEEQVGIKLVDLTGMQRVSGSGSHSLRGFTHHEEVSYNEGENRSSRADIYLLHGMTEVEALATLVHEIAHIWQFKYARKDNDMALREGSCNYLAYLALETMKGKEARFASFNLIESKDKIYGKGFRRVKKFAEEKGKEAWLKILKTKTRLPRGY
jgi:hypothetical protein